MAEQNVQIPDGGYNLIYNYASKITCEDCNSDKTDTK